MVAVGIQTSRDYVQLGAPKTLFLIGMRHSLTTERYDVSRDGKLLLELHDESAAPVVLVTNWDEELEEVTISKHPRNAGGFWFPLSSFQNNCVSLLDKSGRCGRSTLFPRRDCGPECAIVEKRSR